MAVTSWSAQLARRASVDKLLAAAVGALALAFALHHVDTVSLWFDEAWSVGLASQPLTVMRGYIWGQFQNMTLYYVLLHFALRTLQAIGVPATELVLRLPSAVFSAVSAIIVFLLGRRFWSRTAGLVGTTLYIVNYWQLYAAQQVRAYGLQLALISLAWYALLAAQSATAPTARWRWWLGYVGAMTLAVYAQLFSVLVLAAQIAFCVILVVFPNQWQERARAAVYHMVASVAAVVALSLPILVDAAVNGGESGWLGPTHFSALYSDLLRPLANYSVWYLAALITACLVALAALGKTLMSRGDSRRAVPREVQQLRPGNAPESDAPPVIALMCWLVLPVALSWIGTQSYFNHHLFYIRYLVVVIAPLCLLAGVGVATLRPRLARWAMVIALIGLAAQAIPYYYATAQRQDYRSVSLWLERHYLPGDGIACHPDVSCVIGADYYFQAYASAAHFDPDSPGWWQWRLHHSVPSDLPHLEAYATRHHRIFLIEAPIITETAPEQLAAMQAWLAAHGRLVAQDASASATVQLYQLTTSGAGRDPTAQSAAHAFGAIAGPPVQRSWTMWSPARSLMLAAPPLGRSTHQTAATPRAER